MTAQAIAGTRFTDNWLGPRPATFSRDCGMNWCSHRGSIGTNPCGWREFLGEGAKTRHDPKWCSGGAAWRLWCRHRSGTGEIGSTLKKDDPPSLVVGACESTASRWGPRSRPRRVCDDACKFSTRTSSRPLDRTARFDTVVPGELARANDEKSASATSSPRAVSILKSNSIRQV